MKETPSAEGQSGADLKPNVRELVYKLAGTLRRGGLTAGDAAGLRRMDPRRLDAPGFWKLAGMYLDDTLPGDAAARHRAETAWAAVAVALAHLGELQSADVRLGWALASAGLSEQRFVRLLRADEERLLDELPQIARFLAAKNCRADLVGAALLLVGPRPEDERRHLARDYYSALSAHEA